MFFTDARSQFFKPLNGKHKELVAQCIASLYMRQFTSLADYGQSLAKQQIIDAFSDVIANSSVSPDTVGSIVDLEPRKLATAIFSQLREFGWIDERVDALAMQSSYGLSQVGRAFAQPFVADKKQDVRTHHRNTRNTRNALKAFYVGQDVHDLLDAVDYSERIISDFSDVIAELEQRRNGLIEQVTKGEGAEVAAEAFFDFLEQRFEPDLSVRLSADSVERYRDEILSLLSDIRRLARERRLQIERDLRALKLQGFHPSDIWYEQLLKMIEQRLRNACEIMLPAVRDALNSFTSRADAIIRQLASVADRNGSSTIDLVTRLYSLDESKRMTISNRLALNFQNVQLAFVDSQQIRPIKRRTREHLHRQSEADIVIDPRLEADIKIRQAIDNAFSLSSSELLTTISQLMSGAEVLTDEFDIRTTGELLALANVVGAGSDNGTEQAPFEIAATQSVTSDRFFDRRDVFTVRRREVQS